MRVPRSLLGPAALFALLAAAIVLAAYVYHARTPQLALEARVPKEFVPKPGGHGEQARIRFFVRYDEPDATVEIVSRHRDVVRTLAEGLMLVKDRPVIYHWNGLDDEGKLAPPGRYRLRVKLPGQGRDMVFPLRIKVEARRFRPGHKDPT